MSRIALLLLAAVLPLGALGAQTAPADVGSRVRLRTLATGRTWQHGTVRAIDDSTVVIIASNLGEIRVPRSALTELDVSGGRKSRWGGAGKGLAIGGIAGAALGYASGEDCSSSGEEWTLFCVDRTDSAIIIGVLGGAVGSLTGALFGGGERWHHASFPARVAVTPAGGGGWRVGFSF